MVSFIVTNLPTTTPGDVVAVEAWFRRRADIEDRIREAKLGAALRRLPSGDADINAVWMWAALLAGNLSVILQALAGLDHGGRAHAARLRPATSPAAVRAGPGDPPRPRTHPAPAPRPPTTPRGPDPTTGPPAASLTTAARRPIPPEPATRSASGTSPCPPPEQRQPTLTPAKRTQDRSTTCGSGSDGARLIRPDAGQIDGHLADR